MGKFYLIFTLFILVLVNVDCAKVKNPSGESKPKAGGNVAAFKRKWLAGSPCNPSKDLNEGDCDKFWYCKPSSNVTTTVGTWILDTCNIDAPTMLGNLFWNPDEPYSIHGGTCDFWENLSTERKTMYYNDKECFNNTQYIYETHGSCPMFYLGMHPIETLGKYVQNTCNNRNGQTYFDRKSNKCLNCKMVMREPPNEKLDCCEPGANTATGRNVILKYSTVGDGPFPRKIPEAGSCNPAARIPDGNCRDYWFCKEVVTPNSKAKGVKEGAWMFNTCSEPDQIPGMYWNPDGPDGGRCTHWAELSPDVKAQYKNSCLIIRSPRKSDSCPAENYTYTHSDKTNGAPIQLNCPKDIAGYKKLLWDPYLKTCLPCYKITLWAGEFLNCKECLVESNYEGARAISRLSWADWDERSRSVSSQPVPI